MKDWIKAQKKPTFIDVRPYEAGMDMSGVSISIPDKEAGSPCPGDMIARNQDNHSDQWLINAAYFAKHYVTP